MTRNTSLLTSSLSSSALRHGALRQSLTAILFLLLTLGAHQSARAQCEIMVEPPGPNGTEFLLCFERNDLTEHTPADSGACDIYMAAVDLDADVTITCRQFPSMNQTFHIPAHTAKTWRVSDTYPDIWINTTDSVKNGRAVRVTSKTPIVCYGMNYIINTADAFLALPKNSSQTDYRIMSYGTSSVTTAAMPSQFCVAAFSDNTQVIITPSAQTAKNQLYHASGGRPAGVPFTVTLDSGECIQVQTDETVIGSDLTGSSVTSDKAIAVYAGHARAEVPLAYYKPGAGQSTSRDVLIEQMPPTTSWGTDFVLTAIDVTQAPSPRREGDVMRVLALDNGTQLTFNGNPWRTLNANQFVDTAIYGAVELHATNPDPNKKGAVLVGEYAHTSVAPNGDNGDPFLAIVPPMEQTYHEFTFFVSDNPVFAVQKVIVMAHIECVNDITIDGLTLPANAFKSTISGKYALLQLTVAPGTHHISTGQQDDKKGFAILTYGLGYVVSYGYTAGQLLVPQRAVRISDPPTNASHIIGEGWRNSANRFSFHNMTTDDVYLDEAEFIPNDPEDARFNIHLAEALTPETGRLAGGAMGDLSLTCNEQLARPVPGKIVLYNHTFQWHDLEPASQEWTYYPQSAAGVSTNGAQGNGLGDKFALSIAPNPLAENTTVTFENERMADMDIRLFDELGRCVRTLGSGSMPPGPHRMRLERTTREGRLAPGTYTLRIQSQTLQAAETRIIVVQ